MTRPTPPPVSPQDILRTLREHPRRWLVPTGIVAMLSLMFAIVRPRTWEATQALVVRDEVSIDANPGVSSTRAEELKTAQETVVELSHSQAVLKRSLEIVGPGPSSGADFPSAKEVEQLGEVIALVPPKGGEFGKTDIFYLKAQNRDRQRALALARAVSQQVQSSLEELRKTKAQSVIQELEKTVALAQQELASCTCELSNLERQIGGADLSEMRILNDLPSGMSDLRNESFAIESELRKEFSEKLQNEQLLAFLQTAAVDPGELVACPNSLLNAQPGLKRLKDGLVDAQIRCAMLLGSMAPDHPQVVAAREAAEQIGANLHDELAIAVRALEADLRLSDDRIATLESQKAKLRARFDNLADIRAAYGNLAAMAKHRGEILKTAELDLAGARSRQAAAHGGALLQLIGEPVTGTRPIGPGRTTIVLVGVLGGLIFGLGIVVLTAKSQSVVEEEEEQVFAIPQPRREPVRAAFTPAEAGQPSPPLEPVYLGGPSVFVTAPDFVTPSVLPTTETPTGPLTFRQALERIAATKNRL